MGSKVSAEPTGVITASARNTLGIFAIPAIAIGSACSSAPSVELPQQPVVVAIEDAQFLPVSPRLPDGPRIAVLRGDPLAGPSVVLLEMKRGSVPLHLHTSDYHLVVVEGVMKHWGEGQDEAGAKPLAAGSYWFQPGGQVHADACLSEKCVMQILWSGPRDARLPTP